MKLQNKTLSFLIPLILIPLLALSTIAYIQLSTLFKQKSFDQMDVLLNEISNQYQVIQKNSISNIKLFSNSRLVKQYVLEDDDDERYELLQTPLQRLVKSYQNAYPDYYEFRIIFADGYEDFRQTSHQINNATEEEINTPLIQAIFNEEENIYTETSINPDNNQTALYVSNRLILKNKATDSSNEPAKLRGYLALTIDLQPLKLLINNHHNKGNGTILLTDRNGFILLQPEQSELRNIFSPQNEDSKGLKIISGVFEDMKKSAQNGKNLEKKILADNYYIRGKHLNNSIYIFSFLPENALRNQKRILINSIISVLSLTIILTVGLIYLAFKRYILRHISLISNYANEIGRGNLDIDIEVFSNDEIGDLTKSINDMKSSLKKSNERINYIAYHDSLTGLPNRLMFREYLEHTLSSAKRKEEKVALLFLDLDNFKYINDTLGHESGDLLLREISERLNIELRNSDFIAHTDYNDPDNMVARLGGDEFIILLNNIENNFIPSTVSTRVIKTVAKPVKILTHEIHVSVSIGITIFPDDSDDTDTLIKNADIAMYYAKEHGKNNYQYFSKNMNESMSIRLSLESYLRKAISENEFELYYQPQICTKTNKLLAAEALIRWNSSDMGMVFPDQFISIAEESGLILEIGEWVLNEACRQLKEWQNQGLPDISIAVNVSSVQFARQGLPDLLKKLLKKYSLNPRYLEVELTESIFLDDEDKASATLSSIRDMGINVSLDDFGTGYSSLGYLRKYPIDTLKIDRSFILEISNSDEGEAVIVAIISMAHAMGLSVVAEGVEDKTQLTFLKAHKCDFIQGYYYYKPMTADKLTDILKLKQSEN